MSPGRCDHDLSLGRDRLTARAQLRARSSIACFIPWADRIRLEENTRRRKTSRLRCAWREPARSMMASGSRPAARASRSPTRSVGIALDEAVADHASSLVTFSLSSEVWGIVSCGLRPEPSPGAHPRHAGRHRVPSSRRKEAADSSPRSLSVRGAGVPCRTARSMCGNGAQFVQSSADRVGASYFASSRSTVRMPAAVWISIPCASSRRGIRVDDLRTECRVLAEPLQRMRLGKIVRPVSMLAQKGDPIGSSRASMPRIRRFAMPMISASMTSFSSSGSFRNPSSRAEHHVDAGQGGQQRTAADSSRIARL